MKRFVFVVLSVLLLFGCTPLENKNCVESSVCMSFITIGKGDAFLIQSGEEVYLIDTGKAQDFPQIARVLAMKNIKHINGILLSHGHKDHIGSLKPITDAFVVDKVYVSKKDSVTFNHKQLRKLAEANDFELVELEKSTIKHTPNLDIEFYVPQIVEQKNANNNSIINIITHQDVKFLMMGDAEYEEEIRFMNSHRIKDVNVLKLGHHGEKDATTKQFLNKMNPQYALISASKDENPDSFCDECLQRFKDSSTKSYYSQGKMIAYDFISNGKKVAVKAVYDNQSNNEKLKINDISVENQCIELVNRTNQEVSLAGYCIFSTKDDEYYLFDQDAVIGANDCIKIYLDKEFIDKKDTVQLYDCEYNCIDEEEV